jgi:hypothetical protein
MHRLFELLISLYEYDIEMMSQPWMYWAIFPAIFYSIFMLIKWFVLTSPLWIPFVCVFSVFTNKK